MKKRQYVKMVCCMMSALMLVLAGCNADEQANSEDTLDEAVVTELTGEEQYELKYTDIVLDRAKTEGKMAVYFFRGNDTWRTTRGSEHDGDSVLVITPDGTTLLYDVNTPNHGANIVYALQRLGIKKIDYFVNSHPHIDHMGGFAVVAKHIEIGHVYTTERDLTRDGSVNGKYYRKMISMIDELGISYSYLYEGDTFTLGESVQVKVYNPPSPEDWTYEKRGFNDVNENYISILLKLTYGESNFLMGGDLANPSTYPIEGILVEKYGEELQADVAKINHHLMPGSDTPSTDAWLANTNAKLWVGQMSALPDDLEYYRFQQLDSITLHTSLEGAVVVSTTGDGTYDVQMEKDHPSAYGSLDAVDGYMRIE